MCFFSYIQAISNVLTGSSGTCLPTHLFFQGIYLGCFKISQTLIGGNMNISSSQTDVELVARLTCRGKFAAVVRLRRDFTYILAIFCKMI